VAHTGAEGLSRAAQAMPTSSSSTSGSRTSTVSRSASGFASGQKCQLSCCPRSTARTARCSLSTAAPTTTSPSRSGMHELEARLRVALRHAAARKPTLRACTLTVGPVHVDLGSRVRRGQRGPGRADGARVRPARIIWLAMPQGMHPQDDPPWGLGTRLRARDALPARLCEPFCAANSATRAVRSYGRIRVSATSS